MMQSKAGWTGEDLRRLYLGHGFEMREGRKHRLYTHPIHKHLRATVTRSPQAVAVGYIETALDLLNQVDQLSTNT